MYAALWSEHAGQSRSQRAGQLSIGLLTLSLIQEDGIGLIHLAQFLYPYVDGCMVINVFSNASDVELLPRVLNILSESVKHRKTMELQNGCKSCVGIS
jgi:hypothetical protein